MAPIEDPSGKASSIGGSSPDSPRSAALFWIAAAVLLAFRLPHLSGPLDDPNSWRQVDTVHNSLDFYRRGLDLLHPAVPWLGAHRTMVLDFPISPAISSLLYRVFGPSPVLDRLVALGFFLIATWHLNRAVRLMAGTAVARLSTIAWLAFPLGMFYSRAPHIEFAVVCGVNGLLHHGLRACREPGAKQPLLAAAWGTLAGLVKAPYIATVLPPLAVAMVAAGGIGPWVRMGLAMVPPTAAFLWWRHHADTVNATVPDWTFLPDFYKEVSPLWRYTGTLGERLQFRNWFRIGRRIVEAIFAYGGLLFAALAFVPPRRGDSAPAPPARTPSPRVFALAWIVGSAFHVLVFFRLAYIHDYYQTPLLAPCAYLVGLGADQALRRFPRVGRVPLGGVAFVAFLLVALWIPPHIGYYRVDWLREEAARVIDRYVPAHDLMITCDHNTLPPTDPRLLGRADREGWPMRWNEITPGRTAKLRTLGAKWVVIVLSPQNPRMRVPGFLAPAYVRSDSLHHGTRALGELHLFDLSKFGPDWNPPLEAAGAASDSTPVWQHPPPGGQP